ncbi:MAG: PilN domain-containing protein [Thermoanaerobaculia bacterium]
MAAATAGPGGGTSINNILIGVLTLLGVLGALGYWFWNKRELTQRKEVIEARTQEAQKLEAIIKEVEDYQKRKDSLQQRIDLINKLKQNQKGPVRIMDQISKDLPDLVWLDNMTISGGRVTLNGRGLNPNAIALFIENVKNDPYFEEPTVGAMTKVSETPIVYQFDMNFAFTYAAKAPSGTPDDDADTTTAATSTAATQ